MVKFSRDQLDSFIVLLRFQKQQQPCIRVGCMPYTSIAQIVKRSPEYCRQVCKWYLQLQNGSPPKASLQTISKNISCLRQIERKTSLTQDHINHLVDPDTLGRQIGYSLAERSADFMSIFPAKKLAPKKLQSIYKKHKIRKKKVKITKILDDVQRRKIRF